MTGTPSDSQSNDAALDAAARDRLEKAAVWLVGHGPIVLEQGGAPAVMNALVDGYGVVPSQNPVVDHPLLGRYRFTPKARGVVAVVSLIYEDSGVQFWQMRLERARRNAPLGDTPCLSIIATPQGAGLPTRIARIEPNLIMSHPNSKGGVVQMPADDPLIAWRLRGWESPLCVAGTPYEGREATVDATNGARFVR